MSDPPRPARRHSLWPAAIGVTLCAAAVLALVRIDDQAAIAVLLAVVAMGSIAAARFGLIAGMEASAADHPGATRALIAAAAAAILGLLHDDTFGLLMIATVLLYAAACVGLTIQMGYAGLSNFSAAAFLGTGGYTAAALGRVAAVPDIVTLLCGGLAAAAIGSMLILPVLRTRGHYAALTTLAFAVLFGSFLEANQALGGPQGLKLAGINLFGWDFNQDIQVAGLDVSFYASYVVLAAGLAAGAIALAGLIDRSWIGIWLDAVRLDETASAVFGIRIAWWKILAFTLGNFLAGVSGAVYAKMTGFIAPNNFALSESLMMVSIVILGGIGNRWGVLPATAIVILLPEKLQFIQEYRLLIFAMLVIAILMVSPAGLLPRRMRKLGSDISR